MVLHSQNNVRMRQAAGKVPSACQRCRKQKLKCDVQRPCTMCVRANTDCLGMQTPRWIIETGAAKRGSGRARGTQDNTDDVRPPKRLCPTQTDSSSFNANEESAQGDLSDNNHCPSPAAMAQDSPAPATWDSSSTIVLVEEAFHHHHASTPQEEETSAFSASQWMHPRTQFRDAKRRQAYQDPLQKVLSRHVRSYSKHVVEQPTRPNSAESELLALLPRRESASLLVNNYFDRIHWFMLLFHQRDFRDNFDRLYSPSPQTGPPKRPSSQIGYVAVLLSVCAISLQYITPHQRETLARQGTKPEDLKDKILAALKLRLLDVLSLGSLEAVQMCVLLGSYYLYHGQPELAWPLCGCGLRIAQALNLHRKVPLHDSGQEGYSRPIIAARQRCWWAVYEIETFCSMMYGFPLSISDSDCDVEDLNPHDDCSASSTHDDAPDQPNLLFFKCAMSKLSKLVKYALTGLYGTHRNLDKQNRPVAGHISRLRSLIAKVADLDKRLFDWQEALPLKLKPVTLGDPSLGSSYSSVLPERENDDSFEEQLFKLQALALKLAYENARILVHRPLLSYKMVTTNGSRQEHSGSCPDPFQRSMKTCRDAALQISRVGLTSIFRHVSETYAVAFVSLHLFTAGVTLCIMASLDPLSRDSHESKIGIRGLMEMQTTLKSKSIAAAQGFDILRNLLSLVMAKEIKNMFEIQSPTAADEAQIAKDFPTSRVENTGPSLSQPYRDLPLLRPTIDSSGARLSCDKDFPDDNCEWMSMAREGLSCSTDFGFCENPSMTEALLDFEQAIGYPVSNVTGEEDPAGVSDDHSRNYIVGQDQTWMWGWNYPM
ncbi:fungal-specific transcription factor domain-containing protein [Bisporella sp. PMI_857]|nr:fungal-specific transcription factor domain-containing protein [Bisporella sp. PMI_857]